MPDYVALGISGAGLPDRLVLPSAVEAIALGTLVAGYCTLFRDASILRVLPQVNKLSHEQNDVQWFSLLDQYEYSASAPSAGVSVSRVECYPAISRPDAESIHQLYCVLGPTSPSTRPPPNSLAALGSMQPMQCPARILPLYIVFDTYAAEILKKFPSNGSYLIRVSEKVVGGFALGGM